MRIKASTRAFYKAPLLSRISLCRLRPNIRLMTADVFQEALSSTSNLLNMVTASRCRNEVCCADDDHLEKWIWSPPRNYCAQISLSIRENRNALLHQDGCIQYCCIRQRHTHARVFLSLSVLTLSLSLWAALIGKKGALNGAPGGLRLEKIDQPLQTGS